MGTFIPKYLGCYLRERKLHKDQSYGLGYPSFFLSMLVNFTITDTRENQLIKRKALSWLTASEAWSD
jgi:hypothetical protein